MLTPCLRKLNPSPLQRRKPRVKSPLVLVHHQLHLPLVLMATKDFSHLFQSLLPLENFSRLGMIFLLFQSNVIGLPCFALTCTFLFQSSIPVELTEAETEYAVNVVKHIFDSHVVFQYNCTNTIPEQLLERVLNIYF